MNLKFNRIKFSNVNLYFKSIFILIPAIFIILISSSRNTISTPPTKLKTPKHYSSHFNRQAFFDTVVVKHIKTTKWKHADRLIINELLYRGVLDIVKSFDKSNYEVSDITLTGILLTLAQTETSTSKGVPFSNTLFLKANNVSGIKGRGITLSTVEYIDDVRVVLYDEFKSFNSVAESFEYILTMFERPRYQSLHNCKSYQDFFKQMKHCGYYTHPTWYITWSKFYKNYYFSIEKRYILKNHDKKRFGAKSSTYN